MKIQKIPALFLGVALLALSSCGREDNPTPTEVTAQLQESSWRVGNFTDTGVTETVNYEGYTITFNPDFTVLAVSGTDTIEGTYSVSVEDDDNDDEQETELTLAFNAGAPWDELNDDWDISKETKSSLEMDDMSGDDADDDDMHILELEEVED